MSRAKENTSSRRDFLKVAAFSAAAGPFFVFPRRVLASQRPLKIAKWAHFVPEFDLWFESVAEDWGKQHDTKITVDEISLEEISATAKAEIQAGDGHDVFMFPWPPAEYYQHVIDHGDIYQIVASKYGAIPQLAHRSTFNPKNKKYFAFADFWAPSPLHFFQDYWAEVDMPLGPVHYGSLRSGGRKLRDKLGIPCGLSFSPTLEGNVTLHTILYAFRAWVMDLSENTLFNKNAFAVGALNYIQALYQDSGTPDQLAWGPAGNVQAMLAHKTSSTTTCSRKANLRVPLKNSLLRQGPSQPDIPPLRSP